MAVTSLPSIATDHEGVEKEPAMSDTRTQIAATLFRPVAGGYVYREPYRSPFGSAPHYLVNDEQKAELLALIVPKRPILWQVILWGALCLMVATACLGLWFYTGHDAPTGLDTLAVFALTLVQALSGLAILFWWRRRRLRPLIATLTPTDLRITHSEMRAAAANAMSSKQLVIAGVAGVFASTAMLINGVLELALRHPIGLLWLASSVVFAGLACHYFRQLIRRAERPLSDSVC
jgi:hypothetical protein